MKSAEEILSKWDWSNKSEIIEAMKQYATEAIFDTIHLMIIKWNGGNAIEIKDELIKELK